MFHLVFAASAALTLFPSSYCLGAKGKWRILSVQTLMLQKAFNYTSWAYMQPSCQPQPCQTPVTERKKANAITVYLQFKEVRRATKRTVSYLEGEIYLKTFFYSLFWGLLNERQICLWRVLTVHEKNVERAMEGKLQCFYVWKWIPNPGVIWLSLNTWIFINRNTF